MKQINADIKNREFKRIYLLFGEESFLVQHYVERLAVAVVPEDARAMNAVRLEGKAVTAEDIEDAAETLPFLCERRFVLVKDSGLLESGRKDESERLAAYLPNVPDSCVIVFEESGVDKRGRLYKTAAKEGYAAEMKTPDERDLAAWAGKIFREAGLVISGGVAAYLLRTVAHDMSSLHAEAQKLIAYKGGGDGQDNGGEITTADIDDICTKALATRIFDLTDAIGAKDAEKALQIYANMLLMKESPLMILAMAARQFRLILQCGHFAAKKTPQAEAAKMLGAHPFVVKECTRQSAAFTGGTLRQALRDCLETDIAVKTGGMADRLAVELLIVKYCL